MEVLCLTSVLKSVLLTFHYTLFLLHYQEFFTSQYSKFECFFICTHTQREAVGLTESAWTWELAYSKNNPLCLFAPRLLCLHVGPSVTPWQYRLLQFVSLSDGLCWEREKHMLLSHTAAGESFSKHSQLSFRSADFQQLSCQEKRFKKM